MQSIIILVGGDAVTHRSSTRNVYCQHVTTGGRLNNRGTTCKVYDLQVNCMFGNMYPNVVSIDNGPYFSYY